MFPLNTANFPSSASDLERLLNQSLQSIFSFEADPVIIRDASYPHLKEIRVSLDRARLRSDPPRPSSISGKMSPALQVDQLSLSALALLLGPATIDLSLSAQRVDFAQGKDSGEQIVLSLEKAAEGKIEISIAQTDLEALITALGQNQASQQGVTIEGVELSLRQKNDHSLEVQVRLRIRKLFLSASLRISGQIDLDDQLNVRISGLNCTGEGGMASLACSLLTPHLQKIENREFPLMLLPLGNIQLRDVRVTVGDRLGVTAEFGSAA